MQNIRKQVFNVLYEELHGKMIQIDKTTRRKIKGVIKWPDSIRIHFFDDDNFLTIYYNSTLTLEGEKIFIKQGDTTYTITDD